MVATVDSTQYLRGLIQEEMRKNYITQEINEALEIIASGDLSSLKLLNEGRIVPTAQLILEYDQTMAAMDAAMGVRDFYKGYKGTKTAATAVKGAKTAANATKAVRAGATVAGGLRAGLTSTGWGILISFALNGVFNACMPNKDRAWKGEKIGTTFKLPWVHKTVSVPKKQWWKVGLEFINPLGAVTKYVIGDDISKLISGTLENACRTIGKDVRDLTQIENPKLGTKIMNILTNPATDTLNREFFTNVQVLMRVYEDIYKDASLSEVERRHFKKQYQLSQKLKKDLLYVEREIAEKYRDYINKWFASRLSKNNQIKLLQENIANVAGLWHLNSTYMCKSIGIPPVNPAKIAGFEKDPTIDQLIAQKKQQLGLQPKTNAVSSLDKDYINKLLNQQTDAEKQPDTSNALTTSIYNDIKNMGFEFYG